MNRSHLEFRVGDLSSPEIALLLEDHLREMEPISPRESRHALSQDSLNKPDVTFWSVWQDRQVIACGALKELDAQHGEIKSMRTVRSSLRKGIASMVLEQIITEARRRGYQRLSLETGSMSYFEPARALYSKNGFRLCPPFNGYTDDPNSVFMTLEL